MKVNSIQSNLSIVQKQKSNKNYSTTPMLINNSQSDSVSFGSKFSDPEAQSKYSQRRSQRSKGQRFFGIGRKEDANFVAEQMQNEKIAILTQHNVDQALIAASEQHLKEMQEAIEETKRAHAATERANAEKDAAREATIVQQGKALEATQQLADERLKQAEKYERLLREQKEEAAASEARHQEFITELQKAHEKNDAEMIEHFGIQMAEERKRHEEIMNAILDRMNNVSNTEKILSGIGNTKNKEGFGKIAGYDLEKNILVNQVGNSIVLERKGETSIVPNGILFHGPKGNGKSTFAEAFAGQLGCKLIKITNFLEDKENLKHLRNEAQKAQEHFEKTGIRSILLIDEIEKFAPVGSDITEPMKQFMDHVSENYHCTVFATTNHPDEIDDILLRYKRFDIKVGLSPANKSDAAAILEHYTKDLADKSVDYNEIAEHIVKVQPDEAFSNAKIEGLIDKFKKSNSKTLQKITHADLVQIFKDAYPDIGKEAMNMFRKHIDLVAHL